jgi:RNA-directed DNA polymerase
LESPHLYRRDAPVDTPKAVVDRAIQLMSLQHAHGVTPILTLKHLAIQSGVKLSFLERVASRQSDEYRVHSVAKRGRTSRRMIAAPNDELLQVQRWLLSNVFAKAPMHAAAFAYRRDLSAVKCAQQHLGARWALKIDLKDFFHQIDETQVFELALSFGYSRLVSLELARICTREAPVDQPWLPEKYQHEIRVRPTGSTLFDLQSFWEADGLPELSDARFLPHSQGGRLGYLPQGAPTSGAIANALTVDLDRRLSALATEAQLTYTRYADDIFFSSGAKFNRAMAEKHLFLVMKEVRFAGFEPNGSKTRVLTAGKPIELLGIRIDGRTLQLSKRLKDKINFHLRGISKFGAPEHSRHTGFRDSLGLTNYLEGLIRYAYDVDPGQARQWYGHFHAATSGSNRTE